MTDEHLDRLVVGIRSHTGSLEQVYAWVRRADGAPIAEKDNTSSLDGNVLRGPGAAWNAMERTTPMTERVTDRQIEQWRHYGRTVTDIDADAAKLEEVVAAVESERARADAADVDRIALRRNLMAAQKALAEERDPLIYEIDAEAMKAQARIEAVLKLADDIEARGCTSCSSSTGGDDIAADIRRALNGEEAGDR